MRTPKVKPPLEKIVQNAICEYLTFHSYFFWRSNNIPVFGMNNSGKRTFRALPKYTPRGIPDIIMVRKGKFIGIEVKRLGAKLREEQIKFRQNILDEGGKYILAYDVSDVVKELLELENQL